MRYIVAKKNDSICIGRQGENNAVTVQFDVSGWKEMYGNGSFSLLHQRSNDVMAYPCAITSDANTVSWVITSTDVHDVGTGKVQLLYIVNDIVAKSVVYTTVTTQSLNAGDVPDPEPEWITDVLNAGLDAEAYAVGERNGNPVEEGDPAYHNNAKYWAELAESAEGANKIFWVTPDVTTSQEIDAAIAADKYPVLRTVGLSPQRYLLFSGKSSYSQSFIPGQFINYIDYDFEYLSPTGSSVTQKLTVNVNSGYENWGSLSTNSYLATKVSVNTLRSRIAPDYSANATYEVDDYVFQSEYLYKCKEAILTPEAWNPAHWESVVLTTEVFDKINDVIASIDEKADTAELAEFEAAFDGEIFMAPSIETEKVDGGTMIKNQLWLNKCAAIVGAAYSLEEEKLYFYGVLGYKVFPKSRKTLYRLINKDSEEAPYELTPENAPTKSEFSTSDSYGIYKFRLGLSTFVHHVDIRLCCIYYDTSGNEIERVYSSQYRYVVDKTTGAVTRTKFNTADTDPTHVVDIGLYASDASMNTTYNYVDSKNYALLPLVSNVQEIQYRFIVPDSYFNNAPYGLSIVAIMGDKTRYISGSFFKAEETGVLIVTCTPTALDYSGIMDKTVAEMYEAHQAGRRIVAKVVTGIGVYIEAEMTMRFSNGVSEYPSFNAFIIDDGNDQLIEMATGATDDGTENTYFTAIYNLVSKDPIGYSDTSDPCAYLEPCPTTYSFGELGELTINALMGGDGYGQYHFSFSCPSSAPTVLSIPSEISLSGDTTLEAGCYYEVDIWNRIAIIKKIEVAS